MNKTDCYQADELTLRMHEAYMRADYAEQTRLRMELATHRQNCPECQGQTSGLWRTLFKEVAK